MIPLDTLILKLAGPAAPVNDDDWGSERQIVAENRFFRAVRRKLNPQQQASLEARCLKATTEERIAEALRMCGWPQETANANR